jgi:aldehyde:ferredoxin oxidoreductase
MQIPEPEHLMNGWHGRMLIVDLSAATCRIDDIPEQWLHSYLGGRGLGVRLMRDAYRLDPYSPDMPLIFAVGPLCGTPAPTSARLAVVSRSPLTSTIYDCSAGGRFAHRLKATGIDALLITGQSSEPVVLRLAPHGGEIVPATTLWGLTVGETVARLCDGGSVAAIGPAGENRVLFANIMMGEGNSVGRGGLGAVMGSKNLKAIVVNGDRKTAIADHPRLEKARADVLRLFKASPIIFGQLGLAEYGTPTLVDLMRQRRMAPTENFRRTVFDAAGNYSGPAIRKAYQPKKDGCFGCPIQCKKSTPDGQHLPEYETVSHFGALNAIADLHTIVQSNILCNELGLDTISAAATLSAWGELRGCFPATAEVGDLLQAIARRQGEGARLAEGSLRLAESAGARGVSMSVKGLELPAYDPRGAYGMALAYCTSNRGGCHLRAYPISHEILRKPVPTDRFSFAGKARIIKIAEDTNAAIDSLVACKFSFFGATLEEYGEILSAVTGLDYSPQGLKELGERIYLIERSYNVANGFTMADDLLPDRFFTEAGSSGEGIEVPPIDRVRFEEELRKYYRIRGLTEDGRIADSGFLERLP